MQRHDEQAGSMLTDATCDAMLKPENINVMSSQYMSLLARYIVQATMAYKRKGVVNVLDIGCSNGAAAKLYSSAAFQSPGRKPIRYTGIDLYEPALNKAEAVLEWKYSSLRKITLVHHDITTPWPFADASFDVLWYTETIEHVPAPKAMFTLQEAYRVARPGAQMICATPAPLGEGLVWPESHDHEFTREEMQEMLDEAGWSIIDMWGVNVNWTQARTRLRHWPEWFELYETLRRRVGATIAQVSMQALLPDIADDLAWLCERER